MLKTTQRILIQMAFIFGAVTNIQASILDRPAFNQELTSKSSSYYTKKNGESYNTKNWLNPVLHNLYMANNRSEAAEFRANLQQVSEMTHKRIRFVDLLGETVVDWQNMDELTFQNKIQKYHSILGIDTTHLENPNAPIVVLFSSASHNLLSTALLEVVDDLTQAGIIVAMMEYPGYGGSLGTPGKKNWEIAGVGIVEFLRQYFKENQIYLLGHSIGSAVAISVAAKTPNSVSGVISHAGIYNLKEASKDSKKFLLSDLISPLVTWLLANNEFWDSGKLLAELGKSGISTLFIHGINDKSVDVRHLVLFEERIDEVKKLYPKFNAFVKLYESSHEDLFTNANYGPYDELWQSVIKFIQQTGVK